MAENAGPFSFSELSHETYQLSYIDVESCMKSLKELGYNTKPPGGKAKMDALPAIFPLPVGRTGSVVGGDAGKQKLENSTITAPQDRLMILYHKSQTARVAELKELLQDTLDVPGKQVLIEGMLIELTEDNFKSLGAEWEIYGNDWEWGKFTRPSGWSRGDYIPFMLYQNPEGLATPEGLAHRVRASLEAIIQEGKGEVLSSPSVLVINNQNAQIKVVRDVPIFDTILWENVKNVKVRFETVGITLNIKPRISEDSSTVALQILVEVSEAPEADWIMVDNQPLAPQINRRVVQTIARVHDQTPFIIGGLIRNEKSQMQDRIPLLGQIPILGALFKLRSDHREKREVIIVLTPRVIEPQGTHRALLPKDSDRFDFLDNRLFRNSYRLKAEDILDLGFLENNPAVQDIIASTRRFVHQHPEYAHKEPFSRLAVGRIPGEDAVVVRMLFEIVRDHLELYKQIATENLLFFQRDPSKPAGFRIGFLVHKGKGVLEKASPDGTLQGYFDRPYPKDILILRFDKPEAQSPVAALQTPVAEMEWVTLQNKDDRAVQERLLEINRFHDDYSYHQFGLAIQDEADLVRLKSAVILREIAKVNDFETQMTLSNFRVGRRIIIPELGAASDRMFLVDHSVAELFYKSDYYYPALEQKLDAASRIVEGALSELESK
ncbi:MAG: type II and III secretion system protein [Planctomycetes bacterium]|nr:type II and III secretion system protein [Planctomycetota bacterium]